MLQTVEGTKMDEGYSIRAVEKLTGLPQGLLRTWERRYGAFRPMRTPTNRRVYTRDDVERLRLIKAALSAGHSVGSVARLSLDQLHDLLRPIDAGEPGVTQGGSASAEQIVEQCLAAADRLDARKLDELLANSIAALGAEAFVASVAGPLMERLGEAWRRRGLRPSQEHMATSLMRTHLGRALLSSQPEPGAPLAVVTTPRGQNHEIGALMAGLTAASVGWSVRYLGPSLPSGEIAWAAERTGARAILLSLVYPPDDASLPMELADLRRLVGEDMLIIAGGRAAIAYAERLRSSGIELCAELDELKDRLDRRRLEAPAGPADDSLPASV